MKVLRSLFYLIMLTVQTSNGLCNIYLFLLNLELQEITAHIRTFHTYFIVWNYL